MQLLTTLATIHAFVLPPVFKGIAFHMNLRWDFQAQYPHNHTTGGIRRIVPSDLSSTSFSASAFFA